MKWPLFLYFKVTKISKATLLRIFYLLVGTNSDRCPIPLYQLFHQENNNRLLRKGSSEQKSIVGSLEEGHPSRKLLSGAWKRVIRTENFCRQLRKGSSDQKTFVGSLEILYPSRNQSSAAQKLCIRVEINRREPRNFVSEQKSIVGSLDTLF